MKTLIKRKSALIKALQQIDGGRWKNAVEVNETATNLYGYHGDKREQVAEIIIRRKNISGSSNDIGFKQNKDGGWGAIISDFDSSKHNQKWLDSLTQTYAKEVVREVATDNGFSFEERTEGGEIFVTCESSF